MKIAVIADVHGNGNALRCVIEDMKNKFIDSVIVLGDIVCKGPEPQVCYELIKELDIVGWIKGNTDDWFNQIDSDFEPQGEMEERIYREYLFAKNNLTSEAINFIRELPEMQEVHVNEQAILCVHGSDRKIHEPIGIMTPQHEIKSLLNRLEQNILLCAHTHSPYIISYEGKLIMNVGSVGLPNDDPRA